MPGIYSFLGSDSASLLALSVFMCDPNRGYSGRLDIIIFDYCHSVLDMLEAVVSDLWTFCVTASA